MNERNSETDQSANTAKPTNREPTFDFAADRENQRIAWANLERIEANLKRIEAGIQIAKEHDRRAREYLSDLQRPKPNIE
ncbi:hypothetical protein IQ268_16895 [Oculatella sp. LEGE 06141]|uniref:hypothetical protein n=1 Tax=Oculatella sp. LEGE 06141 TaxID=1828648 RepID=UPI00187F408A|nr:hypothetical protein [Oculatella sp. LEGE 06141]MBE9180243.1 hypothetical protein [Oculatella sp. LEGE 06141]